MSPILNVDDVSLIRQAKGNLFDAQLGAIASRLGGQKLGCRLTVVAPGKRAFPFHNHHSNEEMFYIISGSGTLRFGKDRFPVKSGDVVLCPSGGAETAHQLINSSDTEDLRYLAVSTMLEPDVAEYPDSNKFGVLSGAPPGGDKAKRKLTYVGRLESNLDYYDGEET